jgi:hypothetical protein
MIHCHHGKQTCMHHMLLICYIVIVALLFNIGLNIISPSSAQNPHQIMQEIQDHILKYRFPMLICHSIPFNSIPTINNILMKWVTQIFPSLKSKTCTYMITTLHTFIKVCQKSMMITAIAQRHAKFQPWASLKRNFEKLNCYAITTTI